MSLPIIDWSDTAKENFNTIADYIFDNFGIQSTNKFLHSVENLLQKIQLNQQLCPNSKIKGVRKCTLAKQSSLIYVVQQSCIYIIALVDNRTNHKY